MKTFEEWLNEHEGYSLKKERAYDELVEYEYDSPIERWNIVSEWLKAAFEAGVESQKMILKMKPTSNKTNRNFGKQIITIYRWEYYLLYFIAFMQLLNFIDRLYFSIMRIE